MCTAFFLPPALIMMNRRFFSFLSVLFFTAGFLWTCTNPFAPALEKNAETTLILTEQQTPADVLTNFAYAYNFKDSLAYAELLDSSFVFVYFDPNIGNSGHYVSWHRDVDLKTTGKLFRNFDTVSLTWNKTIYEFKEDDTAELSKTLSLNLFGPAGEFSLQGTAIFNFVKNPYDGKWRISRWKDESRM